jgi:ABC transporter DrrB family efflux protein
MTFSQNITFALTDTWIIAKRNLVRYRRIPQLLFFSTVQPIMFLLLFTFVFGGALQGVAGNYINYLLPGILMQTALFGSLQTGVGLADDMTKGIIDRFRSLPMASLAVLAGRTVSDAIRNAFVVLIMLIVGVLIGFRPEGGFFGVLGAAMLAIAFGFAFSWVSATIGLAVKNSETAQVAGFVWVFPLIYISSAYVPVETLPAALKFIAKISPITMTIDAVRGLTSGVGAFPDVWYALLWIVGITVVFSTLAVRFFKKNA